jgi:hypothetical protein
MNDAMKRQVIRFVAIQTGADCRGLTIRTTLVGDLGVAGDDGDDLMDEFSRQFDVDMSEFDASKHFGSEGVPLLHGILFPITWCRQYVRGRRTSPETAAGLLPVTIGDLISAATSRRWLSRRSDDRPR